MIGRMSQIILVYLVVVNIVGFVIMGVDKKRAIDHAWRIPEKTLFTCSFIGGSVGTLAGMYFFKHKTKHWYFVVGMPAILIGQIVIFSYIVQNDLIH